jgi:DNA-binding CsgD family transcriptional regulator
MNDRVARLTDGQRDCLRLVLRHMTSKDIARTLDISPHTVDMRLRTAMRTLDVASRIDAARALDLSETRYQPLIYQRPELVGAAAAGEVGAPVGATSDDHAQQHPDTWPRPEAEAGAGGPPRPARDFRTGEGYCDPVPLANSLPWGDRNRLTPGARLAWIAAIAIGSALGFGAILAALEALKKLL